MKKKKAVMLADTRPALVGIMLLQLKNTNPDLFDEAIIFDVNLTEQDRQLMQAIFPCRFMEYQSPLSKELLRLERFQRFSLIMFARYEMFRLLDEYNTIMWIDTDMVIQGSLSDLLAETEGYGLSILREDPQNKSAESTDCMRTNFVSPISGYQMDAYLCCTGLIIVRDVLHQVCDYTEWCYRKTIEWADNLNMPDQGVINALIQHFGIQIKPIGHRGKYGCWPFPGRDCSGAILVHAWGPNKFWNDWYLYNKFPNWEDCHREWISMGGKALFEELYPTVSVLIPIYKPDLGYLKQCLDSMLDQRQEDTFYKFTDFEVLLLAEPFGKRTIEKAVLEYDDPRLVLLFNEERKGIAASLNRGLKEAKGRYIARMDDDDICADSRFRKQVSFLNHHPEISMCVSDYEYFGDMNEGRIIPEGELSRAWSVLTCPFDHPTVMFRKSFFEANQLYYDENRKYAEDWDLWIRAFEHGMKVGCIHEPLLYHRWHSGNAGQTEASNDQMKATVQDNFRKFGVEIPWEYVPVFCPWWGKAWNEDALSWLKTGFEKALETNRDLNLYDQSSLEKVFSLRMAEAETGVLPEMSWNRYQEHHPLKEKSSEYSVSQVVTASVARRPSRIRLFLKKLFKPLYQPIRHRFEDRLIDIQRATWEIHHTSKENMEGISRVIEMQQQQIDLLNDRLDQMSEEISQIHRLFSDLEVQNNQTFQEISYQMAGEFCAARHVILESLEERSENSYQALSTEVYEQAEDIRQALSAKVYEQAEDTRQTLSSKVYEQAEDTRQALSAKVYEQAEDTRQALSAKVYEQAENSRQTLSAKVYEQAEGTRQLLSEKVYEQAEGIRHVISDKVYEQAENTRQMVSRKIYDELQINRQMTEDYLTSIGDQLYDFRRDYRFAQFSAQSEDTRIPRIFLVGTPEHSNIGDAAITLGEFEFIHRYFPEYRVIELSAYDFSDWYTRIAAEIHAKDLIFLQAGGNLGNIYRSEEELRRRVITDFRQNQIVILPQTVYFSQDEEGRRELAITQQIYNRHLNLMILTRGYDSLRKAKEYFPNAKCMCSLDMALMFRVDYELDRSGVLLCLRDLNDESGLSQEQYDQVFRTMDKLQAAVVKTNNLYHGDRESNIYRNLRWEAVTDELKKFASCKVAITDRLHGLIFAIITHTPCVLIRSFNQKIPEFYNLVKQSNAIFYIDNAIDQLEKVVSIAMLVSEAKYPEITEDYYEKIAQWILERECIS